MTRPQHEATRALFHAEKAWLIAYGWRELQGMPGWFYHQSAPKDAKPVTLRDAMQLTRADLLRYGSGVRSVG